MKIKIIIGNVAVVALLLVCQPNCVYGQTSTPGGGSKSTIIPPSVSSPKAQAPAQAPAPTKVHPFKPLPKPLLPVMSKPFGMPGVIGLVNGKWEGNDYLGHLSNQIGISIELLKGEGSPDIDESSFEKIVSDLFTKESLTAKAAAKEGPPLPFFHILLIVYPVDKDKFVIFANGRIFEQIQVMRKNFNPAGYWQAITWENQDILLVNSTELNAQLKATVEKLAKGFIERYRLYNPSNPESPTEPSVQ